MAAHVDPIEKKPLYHFLPGSKALSVATAGCNFRCGFCQNWQISQAPRREGGGIAGEPFPPEAVVRAALDAGCRSISYTYTEPTIFFEYAYDTARLAREAGLRNSFVTNGYMTAEALETIAPRARRRQRRSQGVPGRDLSGRSAAGAWSPSSTSIRLMRQLGIWVEVTTLVVPGLNDGPDELAAIARFIASVGPEIPWHISRYHPDFEYDAGPPDARRDAAGRRRDRTAGRPPPRLRRQRPRRRGGHALRELRHGPHPPPGLHRHRRTSSANSHCPSCGAVLAGRFA